jgi:hypothetical protein
VLFIFLPGLLLAVAGAVLWSRLARRRGVRAAMSGVNAAVVGILCCVWRCDGSAFARMAGETARCPQP